MDESYLHSCWFPKEGSSDTSEEVKGRREYLSYLSFPPRRWWRCSPSIPAETHTGAKDTQLRATAALTHTHAHTRLTLTPSGGLCTTVL